MSAPKIDLRLDEDVLDDLQYLAKHADNGTRWALAGRSRQKLEDVRRRLGEGASELALIEADVSDAGSLRQLA